MQKRSASGSSSTAPVDAMAALSQLNAAVGELHAAMKALASALPAITAQSAQSVPSDLSASTPSDGRPTPFPLHPDTRDGEFSVPSVLTPNTERPTPNTTDEAELRALSANRPDAFLQADSEELANLWHQGQGQGQKTDTADMPETLNAQRPTPYAPSVQSMDPPSTERLADAVGRLAEAILHGGGRTGSALHPGEAQGGLNGLLASSRLGARPDGYN